MRLIAVGSLVALLATPTSLGASESFRPSSLVPVAGIEELNRSVSHQVMDRDLFGSPYASVVVGNVDVYDRFPYLESRYFQVVSDPAWNRLLYGETESGLFAYSGSPAIGQLDEPRGLAVDDGGRLYVADSGNDRVVVLQTSYEYGELQFVELYTIDGLHDPHDVAVSDAGTSFDATDDVLYVADTGQNRVVSFQLRDDGADLRAELGELGSAVGSFAGPMAIAVGRRDGVNTDRLYVSDAHNGRIVELRDDGSSLVWADHLSHDLGTITSLDTDHWGHLYAAAPHEGLVQKFTADVIPLANLSTGVEKPRSFHVPFITVHDHAKAQTRRTGHGGGIVVEQWSDDSGLKLMDLGVDLDHLAVSDDDLLQVRFTLTDRATVVAEVLDPHTQELVARHSAGTLDSGRHSVDFLPTDFHAEFERGEYTLRLLAESTYGETLGKQASLDFSSDGLDVQIVPGQVLDLGASPNPFNPSTTISFLVPAGDAVPYRVTVFDLRGRLVRDLGRGQAEAGQQDVVWDGRDDLGREVSSGIYMYRIDLPQEQFTGKLAMVK